MESHDLPPRMPPSLAVPSTPSHCLHKNNSCNTYSLESADNQFLIQILVLPMPFKLSKYTLQAKMEMYNNEIFSVGEQEVGKQAGPIQTCTSS